MNDEQRLQTGIRQLQINLDSSQLNALFHFVELLQKWNKTYNLTTIENTKEIISKHILDSLSVMPYLQGKSVIDVGSGAGLPGIPLAIACKDRKFVLLDASAKKTRFIQQSIIEMGLNNTQVLHQRVELYAPEHEFDTVISRAYAASHKFFATTKHLTSNGQFILMLGKQSTLQDLPDHVRLIDVHSIHVPHLQASRHIAVVKSNG